MHSAVAKLTSFFVSMILLACTTSGRELSKRPEGMGLVSGPLVGGIIGGGIGNKLDLQAKELAEIAETKRTREGIVTKFKGDLLFSIGESDIANEARAPVDLLADVVVKYPENHIVIKGFTDSTGSVAANLRLSEDRARTIGNILIARGVSADKIKIIGMGAKISVAPNDTAEGRAKNRRVEIEITIPEEGSSQI